MIRTIINAPSLATGIKYPTEVQKAYTAQLAAEKEFVAAYEKLLLAEAAVPAAEEADRLDLISAVEKGSGAPTTNRAEKAERNRAYADQVAAQAQERYLLAAETTRHALDAHAREMIPTAAEFIRQTVAGYEAEIEKARRIIDDANASVANAARSLHQLAPHFKDLSYTVGWTGPVLVLDTAGPVAHLLATADRVERAAAPEQKRLPAPEPVQLSTLVHV